MTPDIKISVTARGAHQHASTGSSWEPLVGYSRAVRVGNQISVSGTVGVESDGSYSPDLKAQTRRSLAIILAAIDALGGKAADVVRTRIYVTNIFQWQAVGEAHGEVFGQIRPATSMVQVAALIDKDALVEIEADAIVA